jgi:hypothetical protein
MQMLQKTEYYKTRPNVSHRDERVLTVRSVHPDLHRDLRRIAADEMTELTEIYNWALENFVHQYKKEKASGD